MSALLATPMVISRTGRLGDSSKEYELPCTVEKVGSQESIYKRRR